jgi:hypothetical protein
MRLILIALVIACAPALGVAVEPGAPRLGPPSKSEPANPELKAKVRALLSDALKANDVWTALQLEAYGQRIGLRTSPILGASEIIGEPLLAYPSQIVAMWDRGDSEVVVSGGRAYQVASDGRPLALAVPFGGMVSGAGLSSDGKVIAAVEMRRKPAPPVMVVEAHALPSGSSLLRTTLPYTAGDYQAGQFCVAEDGSAVLFSIFDANDASPRLVIARSGDANLVVPGLWQPVGVGAGGSWALAHPYALRTADNPPVALLVANSPPRLLTGAAAGPGIALAVMAKTRPLPAAPGSAPATPAAPAAVPAPAATPVPAPAAGGDKAQGATAEKPVPPPAPVHLLHLIKANGEMVELPQPIGFSKGCRLLSAGRWAVVSSGSDAKTPMTLDLLGNVATTGDEPQSEMTVIYRWSDLVADPMAQPVFKAIGEWVVASNEVNALYNYHDKTVTVLDLSGPEVAERPFAQVDFAIGSVSCEAEMVKVSEDDGQNRAVFDAAGRLLWAGAAKGCDLFAPAWAVIESSGYQLISLNEDAGKRNACKLQIEGTGWDIAVDRYGRRLVATKPKQWVECDLATGKLRRSGAGNAPQALVHEQPVGRFRLEHARLIEKGVAVGSEEPAAGWAPLDAWRDGATLLVLDRNSRIFSPGKRRGYALLGWCDDASYFCLYKGALALANDSDKVIAGFGTGPVLVVDFTGKGMAAAEPLPPGPWRVQGLTFQVPHSGVVAWDAAKAGFMARQLRSPPADAGLLVVTDSLIFDLEAGIARQMGSPEKPAP